ncbi:ArnT family glycosyltransferase [Thioclava electrotropha]|uniref:Glycosyltransferase n=1 Tax=Thioclava electrotropha TaxID=1549850 RepID=A0ABX6YX78_9RHOB|nr:glycosyltransferase family 39 protein [Thioclava electrotropha]QPZ92464.1 glycosyltransferase [Thioclava electrotropha]
MSADPMPRAAGRALPDAIWPLSIVAYFVLQTLYRTALGGALGLDDAQMIFDARSFAWGYGPQLPLFAWLQHLVFMVTGPTMFGLALLKNTLLCGTVLTCYGLMRTRLDPRRAWVATLGLMLLPQIAWESQRALTHSVLATFSAALCFATIWWIARRPSLAGFVTLGLVLGLGLLSKYNFVLLPISTTLALIGFPELRASFRDRRLFLSLLIAAAIALPPYVWILNHPEIAFASAKKFDAAEDVSLGARLVGPVLATGQGVLNFLALPLLVGGLLYWRYRERKPEAPQPLLRLMLWVIVIGLVLLLIGALAVGAGQIKDRWLQPLLFLAGPAVGLWLLPRLSATGLRRLQQVYAVLLVLVMIALPIHFFQGKSRNAAPFETLVPQLVAAVGADATLIAPQWEGANILYRAPRMTVLNASSGLAKPLPDGPAFVIWDGTNAATGAGLLRATYPDYPDWTTGEVQQLAAPYPFADGKTFTLSFAPVVKPGDQPR